MEPIARQLEDLKKRLARIDAKYAAPDSSLPHRALPEGREVASGAGRHWEIDRVWPAHHRHGSADVGALNELPDGLLDVLAPEDCVAGGPSGWVFLDTETTGLAGGAGTLAFLTGVGWISHRGFELRQYFLRDHGEEISALTALAELLNRFDVLITYNGRAFDQPLLETRYVLSRLPNPFTRLRHVDLLYGARRLWKLALESCRLKELESRILGVERTGDPDGALIPNLYFAWLRTGDIRPLLPVLEHNAIDILSLACLTAVVPAAFQNPSSLHNGAEMAGMARWLRNEGRLEESAALLRAALQRRLPDALVWETLWQLGDLERKLGRIDAALAAWSELSTAANPWRAQAYERLAIHYEHREKNMALALEMALAASAIEPSDALLKRAERLRAKAGRLKPGRLL